MGTKITMSNLRGQGLSRVPPMKEESLAYAKTVVLAAALITKGVGIGVIVTSVSRGGLTADTVYTTGLTIAAVAVIVLAVVPLYWMATKNRTVLGLRITNLGQRIIELEKALKAHKAHDRAALQEAVQYNDLGTGPQPRARARIVR